MRYLGQIKLSIGLAATILCAGLLWYFLTQALLSSLGLAGLGRPPIHAFANRNDPGLTLAREQRWEELRRDARERGGKACFAFRTANGTTIPLKGEIKEIPKRLIVRARECKDWVHAVEPQGFWQITPVYSDGGVYLGCMVGNLGEKPRERPVTISMITRLCFLLVLFAVSALTLIAGTKVASSLVKLRKAAEGLGRGELRWLKVPTGPKELRLLAGAFNQMQRRLDLKVKSLEEARLRAEKSERAQREFQADISHRLATPLAALQMNLEALASGDIPEHQVADYHQRLFSQVSWVSQTMRRLLDLSCWEQTEPDLYAQSFCLGDVFYEVEESLHHSLWEAGIDVQTEGLEDAWVRGDRGHVRDILTVMVENCVQHSGGNCSLTVGAKPRPRRVEIEIVDSGLGMPTEKLATATDRYVSKGRTGLGLAIASRLIQAHGGVLCLENSLGGGLLQRFALPCADS